MQIRNLFRPLYIAGRLHLKFHEWRHPDEPWIAAGAVKFCEQILTASMQGLEWGSGRSTGWFANRLGHLTSIESDEVWLKTVDQMLESAGATNVTLKHIPLEHPHQERYSPYYKELPAYVRAIEPFPDQSLDFVVVDGHYRQPCIWSALPKIKPGGYLLVDNTDWLLREYWPVPLSWEMVHQSRNALTQTTIWRKPPP